MNAYQVTSLKRSKPVSIVISKEKTELEQKLEWFTFKGSGAILKAYKFLLNSLDRLYELYLPSDNLTFYQNSRIIKLLNFYIRVWSVSIIA